jgi:hypothetical protein
MGISGSLTIQSFGFLSKSMFSDGLAHRNRQLLVAAKLYISTHRKWV